MYSSIYRVVVWWCLLHAMCGLPGTGLMTHQCDFLQPACLVLRADVALYAAGAQSALLLN
jgi:hypothetical protein